MITKVTVKKETYEEIKVGDEVVLDYNPDKIVRVRKMVETKNGVYAVFSNRTWRPTTTYGYTWAKLGVH